MVMVCPAKHHFFEAKQLTQSKFIIILILIITINLIFIIITIITNINCFLVIKIPFLFCRQVCFSHIMTFISCSEHFYGF